MSIQSRSNQPPPHHIPVCNDPWHNLPAPNGRCASCGAGTMTDAGLTLALARMMGHAEVVMDAPYVPDEMAEPHEHRVRRFNPIHNGADFDAVLMWGHENLRTDVVERTFQLEFGGIQPYTEFRRAVCEAIVEASK